MKNQPTTSNLRFAKWQSLVQVWNSLLLNAIYLKRKAAADAKKWDSSLKGWVANGKSIELTKTEKIFFCNSLIHLNNQRQSHSSSGMMLDNLKCEAAKCCQYIKFVPSELWCYRMEIKSIIFLSKKMWILFICIFFFVGGAIQARCFSPNQSYQTDWMQQTRRRAIRATMLSSYDLLKLSACLLSYNAVEWTKNDEAFQT